MPVYGVTCQDRVSDGLASPHALEARKTAAEARFTPSFVLAGEEKKRQKYAHQWNDDDDI